MPGGSSQRYGHDQASPARSRANTAESGGARDSRIASAFRDDGPASSDQGPPSASSSRQGSLSEQSQEGKYGRERSLPGSLKESRTAQLSPISTRFNSAFRSSHSTSASSTPASAASSAPVSPLLARSPNDPNISFSQPASLPSQPHSELPYDQPFNTEPSSYLSDTSCGTHANIIADPTRKSPSPRNSSLLLSTSPSNRSNSPSGSTGSPVSSSGQHNQYQHPRDNVRTSSGDSSRGSVEKPGLSIAVPRSADRSRAQVCAKCDLPMTGQFVRALGSVFHLDCFRCQVSPCAMFYAHLRSDSLTHDDITGLQQSGGRQVFPRRCQGRKWSTVSSLRNGLLQKIGSTL